MTYRVDVDAGGAIAIPVELLAELGIKEGDSLVFERAEDGGLTVKPFAQLAQRRPEGSCATGVGL